MNKKRLDIRGLSLLIPAIVYTIGLTLYSGEVLRPGTLTMTTARVIGSWFMVVGSEFGTLPAIIEVYRKRQLGRATLLDYFGIAVSAIATLINVLVVFTKETPIEALWVLYARTFGPIVLILAQAGDYYFGSGMEYGLYIATEEQRAQQQLQLMRARLEYEQRMVAIERERDVLRKTASIPVTVDTAEDDRPTGQMEAVQKPKFVCPHCGRSDFKSRQALAGHIGHCKRKGDK